MTDTPPTLNQDLIDQIMGAFTALQNKIVEQEQRIQKLETKGAEHDVSLANHNLWHNSRIFGRISRFYPKTRSVVFYHPHFFCDNIKYAFLKFMETARAEGIACHYLTHNDAHRAMLEREGFPCFPAPSAWTMEHFNAVLQAKVLVVQDDFTPFLWDPQLAYFLLHGAKLVQLWHGIPIKEIGAFYTTVTGGKELKMAATGPADVLVAPGVSLQEDWRRWASYREFAPVGYPRNDVLLRDPTPHELINVDAGLWRDVRAAHDAGRKVVFYAPTFRDGGGLAWFERAGIERFSDWCREKNILFVTKAHPFDHESFGGFAAKMPNIRFADPQSDIYPLLRYTHALITDYSSLAFDFMLLDRPIVFYRPDHVDYISRSRNILPHYDKFSAGAVVADIEGLCHATAEAVSGGSDPWAEARRALTVQLFDHRDAKASERVTEVILKQLAAPQDMVAGWAP